MQSLNPSCKLIGLLVVTLTVAYVHHPVLNLALFALSVLLVLAGGQHLKAYLVTMLPIVIIAIGMFFTGYRFTKGDVTVINAGALGLAGGRVWNGLIFSSRVLVYAGIGLLFAMTTDRIRMVRSFERQLHVPQIFAYGVLAAWGLLPQMVSEYRRTQLAFRARGLKVSPVSPRLLTTLMVKATRWSEELSIAMESRGFSGYEARSCYEPERVRRRDVLFLIVTCAVLPALSILFFH